MFDSIGWGEIFVLALAALFIFGPERLPDLAKEAAAGLKRLRGAITGVRAQVNDSLGDDFEGFVLAAVIVDDHVRTGLGEGQRESPPGSERGARHEGDSALEVRAHRTLLRHVTASSPRPKR